MLVLKRFVNQRIRVGDVIITVVDVRGKAVRLGIEAPSDVQIDRVEPVDHVESRRATSGEQATIV